MKYSSIVSTLRVWAITRFLGLFFLFAGIATPAAAQNQDVIDAFARQVAADVEADGIGAITAAVFKGDQVLWAQGFGWADPDKRVPAGVRTIYRTGSISKSFTMLIAIDWPFGSRTSHN